MLLPIGAGFWQRQGGCLFDSTRAFVSARWPTRVFMAPEKSDRPLRTAKRLDSCLWLRRGSAQSTLAPMKEIPMSGVRVVPDSKAPIPRQIRYIIGNEGRAVQLLRDAQHPDGVPGHVAAHVFARSGSGERGEGCVSYLRHRRLSFSAARWVAGQGRLFRGAPLRITIKSTARIRTVPGDRPRRAGGR